MVWFRGAEPRAIVRETVLEPHIELRQTDVKKHRETSIAEVSQLKFHDPDENPIENWRTLCDHYFTKKIPPVARTNSTETRNGRQKNNITPLPYTMVQLKIHFGPLYVRYLWPLVRPQYPPSGSRLILHNPLGLSRGLKSSSTSPQKRGKAAAIAIQKEA